MIELKLKIINDPVPMILQAAEELWPDLECEIQYNHELDIEKNEFGVTIFPDDGSIPLVEINPALSVQDQIEIIGHELAHVRVGAGKEHGPEWVAAFEAIHNKFTEILHEHYTQHHEADEEVTT